MDGHIKDTLLKLRHFSLYDCWSVDHISEQAAAECVDSERNSCFRPLDEGV